MTLNPVESSMIVRAGYDPALLHLRAVMQDGSVYDVAPVSHAEYAEFMAAPSKGIYWHRVFAARAYKTANGKEGTVQQNSEPDNEKTKLATGNGASHGGGAPLLKLREPEKLNTFDPDRCCGKHLSKALSKYPDLQEFVCPVCGCDWKPEQKGPLRHWSARPVVMVFRGR